MEKSITHEVKTYYDLSIPNAGAEMPLLIATHGYGGDKGSMARLAKRVDGGRFVIASLQGMHQHFKALGSPRTHKQDVGFGWLSPWKPEESKSIHHDSVSFIIDTLAKDGTIDPTKVFMIGFSQSVSLNLRFALTYPGMISGIVGICGGIPFDLESNPIYNKGGVDAFYLHMSRDEFYTPKQVDENVEKLRPFVKSLTVARLEGGHTISHEMFPLVESWLSERLDSAL